MNIEPIQLEKDAVHKLLSAASGDAALLYLFLRSGNREQEAAVQLQLNESRVNCAMATLRQLGLCQQESKGLLMTAERPHYTEQDVLNTMNTDPSFRSLYGEVQRRLGRTLTTEELKILLSFVNYLGLPEDVVCILVSYCQERSRQRGSLRNPTLRTIEKEAYAWAEKGIDTIEAAAAFIHSQNVYHSRMAGLMRLLQIRGRNLTPGEEKYAAQWLQMELPEDMLALAYEKTCVNTGGLNWAYMHKILLRWKQAGYRSLEDVKNGDRKGASTSQNSRRQLDADELAAIERMLQEG